MSFGQPGIIPRIRRLGRIISTMSPTSAVAREPHTVRTSASLAARERAKEAVRAQLRAVARRHIAERGASDLSLRAVARELNMTSSAVYRLISSRDELFTSLIVESYNSLAEVAEQADRIQAGQGQDAAARWLAICRAVREWALAHPHEYSLLYGSPIPGYLGPKDVAQGSTRIWRVVAGVMDTAVSTGVLRPQSRTFEVDGLVSPYVLATVGRPAPPFTDSIIRGIALFSSLIGGISAELFGHFHGLTTDPDRVFDLVVATGALGAGLELPVDYVDGARGPEARTTVNPHPKSTEELNTTGTAKQKRVPAN
jgi:AcrR family transcriptional regulator